MEFTGELIKIGELEQGTSQGGSNWKRLQIVVMIDGKYPQYGVFKLINDATDRMKNFTPGEMVTVSYDMDGRENKGKWYADLKAWKVERYSENKGNTHQEEGFVPDGMDIMTGEKEKTFTNDDGSLPF